MILDTVAGITDHPISHVALSHEHYDHIGGTELFSDADIINQEDGVGVLDLSVFAPAPQISVTFDDSLTVDLGGINVDLLHYAPGDGVGTSIAWVPSQRVVYSADMYERNEFTIPQFKEDTNFVGVRETLNEMVALDPLYAINTHDDGNSAEALRVNAVMMNELYDAVNARFQEAFASDDGGAVWGLFFSISDQVRLDQYSDWENYDTAFPNYVWRMAASMFHGG
jgi:glyoxylase-like metal-dependent hydrolase (beta-lactamase superfamily II)